MSDHWGLDETVLTLYAIGCALFFTALGVLLGGLFRNDHRRY